MEPTRASLHAPIPQQRAPRGLPVRDRILWRLIHEGGVDVADTEACWHWPGSRNKAGYGRVADSDGRVGYVHRIMWRETNGPVPAGAEVDHECHNRSGCNLGDECPHRSCCNPAHLAAITLPENRGRRRTELRGDGTCRKGDHPFIRGSNGCKTCANARMRKYLPAWRAKRAAEGHPTPLRSGRIRLDRLSQDGRAVERSGGVRDAAGDTSYDVFVNDELVGTVRSVHRAQGSPVPFWRVTVRGAERQASELSRWAAFATVARAA